MWVHDGDAACYTRVNKLNCVHTKPTKIDIQTGFNLPLALAFGIKLEEYTGSTLSRRRIQIKLPCAEQIESASQNVPSEIVEKGIDRERMAREVLASDSNTLSHWNKSKRKWLV